MIALLIRPFVVLAFFAVVYALVIAVAKWMPESAFKRLLFRRFT